MTKESSLLSEQIYTSVLMQTVDSCIKFSCFIWRQNFLFEVRRIQPRISNRLEFACPTKIVGARYPYTYISIKII